MARFRLLSSHSFNTTVGPAFFETNSEIESSAVIGFKATVLMEALDSEAEAMLAAECERLRMIANSNTASTERACLPGIGPVQRLPY